MPETNTKPSFKNLWLRISDRAMRGKMVLTPATALQVAHSLMLEAQQAQEDTFAFAVEQWDHGDPYRGSHGACRNAPVARAAFEAAVKQRPGNRLYLRRVAYYGEA